tara:strand:- start:408 stop:1046 length:639 start_codon:yes stop_codon:yes gene_type:complete
MSKKKYLPNLSEVILYTFFLLFLGLCLIFYFNIRDKCRNTKDFDFSSINKNKTYAVLIIDCGEIVIEINNIVSPINSKRFLKLIANKEYVDSYFYKVKENKLVEAGDLKYGKIENLDYLKIGTGGSEYNNLNSELSENFDFTKGSVGMVRRGKFDTENSQFFILIENQKSFNLQYTPIGKVISDLEILKTIKSGDTTFVLRPDKILDSYRIN